jgi:hypothetical protein
MSQTVGLDFLQGMLEPLILPALLSESINCRSHACPLPRGTGMSPSAITNAGLDAASPGAFSIPTVKPDTTRGRNAHCFVPGRSTDEPRSAMRSATSADSMKLMHTHSLHDRKTAVLAGVFMYSGSTLLRI